jgi:hypothetical protein
MPNKGKDWSYDMLMEFIITDSDFNREYIEPLRKKFNKDFKKDTYNRKFAISLWGKIIDKAIDQFYRIQPSSFEEEMGIPSKVFPKQVRIDIAEYFVDQYEDENNLKISHRVIKRFKAQKN